MTVARSVRAASTHRAGFDFFVAACRRPPTASARELVDRKHTVTAYWVGFHALPTVGEHARM